MNIKPITVAKSIWFFLVSSAVIYTGVYYGIPFLQSKGVPFLIGYLVLFHGPLFLLIITALILYNIEGHPWSLDSFKERLWLNKMERSDWLWSLGLFVFGITFYLLLSPIGKALTQVNFFAPPDFFPAEINPQRISQNGYFMDYKLSGKYWIAIAYFTAWITNILGEELLFRGMIFRRQIIKYGTNAWIYHGVIWTLWHFFWKWNLVSIFPFGLALSFTVYKRQNIWIGIIAHGAMNIIPLIMIIIGVFK